MQRDWIAKEARAPQYPVPDSMSCLGNETAASHESRGAAKTMCTEQEKEGEDLCQAGR